MSNKITRKISLTNRQWNIIEKSLEFSLSETLLRQSQTNKKDAHIYGRLKSRAMDIEEILLDISEDDKLDDQNEEE